MKKKQFLPLFIAGLFCAYPTIGTTEPLPTTDVTNTALTTIEITNEVLVHETIPLGINLVGDNYYDPGVMLKIRDTENFEGTSYRQAHVGLLFEDGFASCWRELPGYEKYGWADLMRKGGQYTLISGPAKWSTGTIAGVSSRTVECWKTEKEALFFEFDKKFSLPNQTPISNMGLLVENLEPIKHGHLGKPGSYWDPSANCSLIEGDTPPDSYGYTSLVMDGTSEPATIRLSSHKQKYADLNGLWKYSLWAKVKQGTPQVTLSFGGYVETQAIEISASAEQTQLTPTNEWSGKEISGLFGEEPSGSLLEEEFILEFEVEEPSELKIFEKTFTPALDIQESHQWKKYELTFQVDEVPELTSHGKSPSLYFLLTVKDGIIIVDDLEVKMEGDKNPTAFRDEIVTALKRYNPGVIRKLQMGGDTVKSTIMPRLKSHRGTHGFFTKVGIDSLRSLKPYGLHEFYELSEYIKAEPWFSLPGTMTQTEMEQFLEYLGAPADVGWGKLRAELGHPQPWTQTLRKIHVEIGNEAWNLASGFIGGGFNGPDYWHDLFATAKNSPYYRDNIILHAAGQNYSSWMSNRILEYTHNADRYAIAPYQIHTLNQTDVDIFNGDVSQFFSWLFARSLYEIDNKMPGHQEVMDKTEVEFSIYEVNHHSTKGDVANETRNHLVASLGAGLNISNYMLQQLKRYGIRTQAFFNFSQFSFNMAYYGNDDFLIRLWGAGLNFRQGHERFRPTWLANELVNKVLGGKLLKTVHTGANPTYTVTGSFNYNQAPETKSGFPEILSYAFAKGKKRGLILYNLSTTSPHQVLIKFEPRNEPANPIANSWLLTADSIAANNEPENAQPQVQITEITLEKFHSGTEITLPKHSLQVISWQAGVPLLVELIDFKAVAKTNNIRLSWQTGAEKDNAGFYIWRIIEESHDEYTNITKLGKLTSSQADCLQGKLTATTGTSQLISARGDSKTGACYSFKETVPNGTYYYLLESIDMHGKRTFHCDAIDAVTVGKGPRMHLEKVKNYCKKKTGSKY